MDKGFNDDELADIMNEIESLEKEFSDVESHDQVEEEVESEVLEKLSDMPKADAIGEAVESHDDEVRYLKPESSSEKKAISPVVGNGAKSAMSFTVVGDMKLDLSFDIAGKVVHLNISEDCFELEFDEGMKFTIPVSEVSKKAA